MAEHRGPRRPGGAGGEDERGEVVVVDLDGRHLLGTEQIVERGVGARHGAGLGGDHVLDGRQVGTRSTCAHACAASGSTTTTLRPTVCTSRSISGAGLAGLSGTVTAPSPSAARYRSTK
jgi:hypothetical protein